MIEKKKTIYFTPVKVLTTNQKKGKEVKLDSQSMSQAKESKML